MRLSTAELAVTLLTANRPRLIVLVAGSLAVALAASSISLASVVSLASVRQTVDAGWRGTYDILVRPADARTLTVAGRQIVPANYLGARSSGITRQQWDEIRTVPGVQAAAPVAALGWLKQDSSIVTFELPEPAQGDILRLDLDVEIAGAPASRSTGFVAVQGPGGPPSLVVGVHDLGGGDGAIQASVGDLPSIWGLVVGIDPVQEDQLIGLGQFVLDGDYLERGVTRVEDPAYGGTALSIPVMTAGDLPLPGTVSARVSRITGADPAHVMAEVEAQAADQSGAELTALVESLTAGSTVTTVADSSLPLADLLQPLRDHGIFVKDGQLEAEEGGGAGAAFGRNAILVPEPLPYQVSGDHLSVKSQGSWDELVQPQIDKLQPDNFAVPAASFGGDAQVFRPLHAEKPPLFRVNPVADYDLSAIGDRYSGAANYVPLGIYADVSRTFSDSGDAVPTSLNPGGLDPLPPVGLTNLEAVEALRGDHFIDAVRVKLEGISGYSPAAMSKIEAVAAAIVQRTGLHVDVVAGSSPIDVQVAVEGGRTVTERWTTLGEAVRIENGVSGFSGLLLLAAIVVVLLYLLTFGLFLVGDQGRELAVLRLVGWRRSTAVSLVALQATGLGALSGALALAATLVMAAAMDVRLDLLVLAVLALAVVCVHLAAAGTMAIVVLARQRGVDNIRGRSAGTIWNVGRGGIFSFAMAQAAESRARLVGTVVALALAIAVAGAVIGLQALFHGRLSTTVLGQLVSVRIGPYHLLAAAGALFAAGAMAIDAGVLTVERRLSLIGLLRALGWRARQVRRLILIEVGLPGAVAGVLGGALIAAVLLLAGSAVGLALVIALTAATAAAMIGFIAALPAADLATSVAPASILRVEGESSAAPGFSGRSALLSLGTFAALAVAGAVVWSAISPIGIPAGAFARLPSAPPLTAAEAAIEADVAAISAHPDRHAGSESMRAAQDYVHGELEKIGFSVERVPFVSDTPQLLTSDGKPIDPERKLSSFLPATIAYAPSLLHGDQRFEASAISYLDGTQALAPSCPAGLVILRVGIAVNDYARAALPAQLLTRCSDTTEAVLGVTAPEPDWVAAPTTIGEVDLVVGYNLVARLPASSGGPWLLARLDASGPGATQSAAASALALEIARLAVDQGAAVQLAFLDEMAGGVPTLLRDIRAADGVSLLVLGTLSGADPTLGTTAAPSSIASDALTSALLSTVEADGDLGGWVTDAQDPGLQPTSEAWLQRLAASGLPVSDAVGQNVLALAVGMDAAVLTEKPDSGAEPIAGTSADTATQVDVRSLGEIAERLAASVSGQGGNDAGPS